MELARALELREERAGDLGEVGRRLGELAREQRTVHEAEEEHPAAVLLHGVQDLEARRSLLAARRLLEVEPDGGRARGLGRLGRGVLEGPLAGPEDDVRLCAHVAQRRGELLRLAGEGLVDEHHRPLAGLDLRGADQVVCTSPGCSATRPR